MVVSEYHRALNSVATRLRIERTEIVDGAENDATLLGRETITTVDASVLVEMIRRHMMIAVMTQAELNKRIDG